MADILILANSIKKGEFCVAGKDIKSNRWVRIVGNKYGLALTLSQIAYNDLANKRQMASYEPFNKIIRLNLGNAVPLIHQPENILIGLPPWQEIQVSNLNITLDTPVDLWGAGDRIRADYINQGLITITQSLYLIQVTDLNFYTTQYENKEKRRVHFQYGNNSYNLGATMNPQIFQGIVNGTISHNNMLTISLGDSFLNRYTQQHEHYKLVAAVF